MLESVKKWSAGAPFLLPEAHASVQLIPCALSAKCLQWRARVKKRGSGQGGVKGHGATSRLYVLPGENRVGTGLSCTSNLHQAAKCL